MTFRPRQYEDDIYPWDDSDLIEQEYYEDPDHQRDLQMEREWEEDRLMMQDEDPMPFGWGGKTGGWVDEYMVRTYGRGPGS